MSSMAGTAGEQQRSVSGGAGGTSGGDDHKSNTDDMEIVLEMVGRGASFPVAVRKVSLGPNTERVKLVVDLPTTVGAETANLTAAMVLDELDRLPPTARVAGILMASVQFTVEGADGLQAFLASHAAGIRHVALHDVLPVTADATAVMSRLVQVCQAFASSPLQVLDVSRNCIVGASLWKVWTGATNLEQIILDGVTLDTAAWKALSTSFVWENLEDLHVVLQKGPDSPAAWEAVQSILRNCTRISSLRWVQRSNEGGPAVPCAGLREMAANMHKVNTRGGSLRHLVLGGSFYPAPNADLMHARDVKDLCTALQDLPRLRTLKLRSLGITEVDRIVATLRHTRPPLEVLDLSYNMLANVQALLELSTIPKVNKELRAIVLSHNMIDTKQGRELFTTFADLPIDLTLDNNKVDFAALVRTYQEDLRSVERDRDDWRAQAEGGNHGLSAELVAEMAALKAENKRLRDEREVMMRAFNLTGTSRQVEEQRKLLDRVQRLEDMVTLGAVFKPSADRKVVERGNSSRNLDRRSSRRLLVGELPLQMERLRSVSSRSIGSANRSYSNRSQSTAGMTEDVESSVRSSSRANSPAPAGALVSTKGTSLSNTASATTPQSPMLFQTGTFRSDRRGSVVRSASREEEFSEPAPASPVRMRRSFD